MKHLVLSLLVCSVTFSLTAKADLLDLSSAPAKTFCDKVDPTTEGLGKLTQLGCFIGALTVSGASVTSLSFLKEMQEVKGDAINYIAGEDASPALESVVEKIQNAASEQGNEVSFDEVVEALIQL